MELGRCSSRVKTPIPAMAPTVKTAIPASIQVPIVPFSLGRNHGWTTRTTKGMAATIATRSSITPLNAAPQRRPA